MKILTRENERLSKSNEDLLNRLQSEDLKTYHSLTSTGQPFEQITLPSRTDAGELAQLQNIQGLGEGIYDNDTGTDGEFDDFLRDIGSV